jgi:hypothetical protein
MTRKRSPALIIAAVYLLMALAYAADACWYHWSFFRYTEAGLDPYALGYVGMVFTLFALAVITLLPTLLAVVNFFCDRPLFCILRLALDLPFFVLNLLALLLTQSQDSFYDGGWLLHLFCAIACLCSMTAVTLGIYSVAVKRQKPA